MSQYEYCEIDYEILKAGWFKHIYIWVARDIPLGSRSYGEVIYRFRPHQKAEEVVENPHQPPRSSPIGLAMLLNQRDWERLEDRPLHRTEYRIAPQGEASYNWRFYRDVQSRFYGDHGINWGHE